MHDSVQLQTVCYRITQHCNLSCYHCRSGSSPRTRLYSRTDLFLNFARLAQNDLGLRHVSISGGEPTLDRRLPELVEQLVSMGLFVSITTNGSLNLQTLLQSTSKVADRVRFRVSLDGPRALHEAIRGAGTHLPAVRSLRQIQEAMGWVGVNTVALPDLLPIAEDLVSIPLRYNVSEWALITPVPQGTAFGRPWARESLVPTAHALKAALLAAGFLNRLVVWDFLSTPETSVLIEANGDVVLSGLGKYESTITRLGDCDLASLARAIREANARSPRTHFTWRGWR
jgi:MoaA/NifB/PqqE/SkfB family radical SAM enzyme